MSEDCNTVEVLPHAFSTTISLPELGVRANGKGLSEELSLASAYGEMLERISAGLNNLELHPYKQYYGEASRVKNGFDTFTYLPGYVREHQDKMPYAIRVEDLLGHVPHLKQDDYEFIKNNSEFTKHWVDGHSLMSGRRVKVPLMLVRWISATNGLAAGNTLEEAILHGSYECIERYVAIKAAKEKMTFPTIAYDTIETAYLKELLDAMYRSGIEFHIKEMSMDLNVFITGVMFVNHNVPKDSYEHHTLKIGVACDTEEALARCLIERLQGTDPKGEGNAPTLIDKSQKDWLPLFFKGFSPKSLEFMKVGNRVDFHSGSYNNTEAELNAIKSTCEVLQTDLIVVDQTHPMLRFPTVRVIMPGISDSMRYWDPDKLTKEMIADTSKDDKLRDERIINIMRSFYKET